MATATRAKTQKTNGKANSPVLSRASRPAAPRPVRWTHEQYHDMADRGYFRDKRVELIGGEIIEMTAMHEPHWVSSGLVEDALRSVFGEGHIVVTQKPLRLPKISEPEPDIAIIQGSWRDYNTGLPTTALLVVEISDATLRYDRTTKASLYAAAGIEDYWIVNLNERQIEVHRTPVEQSRHKFGWAYKDKTEFQENDTVSPLAAPQAKIKVAELLP